MRVRYPGPMGAVVIDNIEIKRGEEGDLTQDQFKRAETLGVERVEVAADVKETKKDSAGE